MSETTIAVWVSNNISHEQASELFDKKKNIFEKSFHIRKENDFFDDSHMIIIDSEIECKPTLLKEVKPVAAQYSGISECWDNIEKSIQENNINEINYLLAVPNFKYSGKIKRTEYLLFVGNFTYKKDLSYLDEYFK